MKYGWLCDTETAESCVDLTHFKQILTLEILEKAYRLDILEFGLKSN